MVRFNDFRNLFEEEESQSSQEEESIQTSTPSSNPTSSQSDNFEESPQTSTSHSNSSSSVPDHHKKATLEDIKLAGTLNDATLICLAQILLEHPKHKKGLQA